jgi:hypothetical protein
VIADESLLDGRVDGRQGAGGPRPSTEGTCACSEHLERGDVFLARVQENVARTQELVAANAEFVLARHAPISNRMAARLSGLRDGAGLSSGRSNSRWIHRDRGQMYSAHRREAAAEWLAFIAEVNEEETAEEELGRLVEGDGERQPGRVSARHLPPDGAAPCSQRTVRGARYPRRRARV